MAAEGYVHLTAEQVNKLKRVEANCMGSGILPRLVDNMAKICAKLDSDTGVSATDFVETLLKDVKAD